MKAVLLAPELAARDGGIQRILRLYLQAMAEDEAVSSLALVVLNDRPGDLARLPLTAGNRIKGKPLSLAACGGSKPAFVRAAWQAGSRAERMICGHLAQLPVAAMALRPGARLACVAHGIEAWKPLPALRRIALSRVSRMICVSRYTCGRMEKNHPSLKRRLRVVPNALDPELLEGTPPWVPPLNRAPIILTAGRLCAADSYKGYDLLIEAFARMPGSTLELARGREPRLRVVGDGDDLPRLRELATRLGVGDRVEFSGHLSDPELRQAFADCSCFALPSTGEGFGLVYLEALAAGRPCVGVNAAATPELITPETGLLAPPGDANQLAETLAQCLARFWDPNKLREHALRYSQPRLTSALAAAWR